MLFFGRFHQGINTILQVCYLRAFFKLRTFYGCKMIAILQSNWCVADYYYRINVQQLLRGTCEWSVIKSRSICRSFHFNFTQFFKKVLL